MADTLATAVEGAAGFGLDLDVPFDGSSPELLSVMCLVVGTYFGLMVLYAWLASMIDEDPDSAGDLHRHSALSIDGSGSRTARHHRRGPVGASSDVWAHGLTLPDDVGDAGAVGGLQGIKESLASQAANYIATRLRECGSVARRKLYLRRLAAAEAAKLGMRSPGAVADGASAVGAAGAELALAQPGRLEGWVDAWLDAAGPAALDASREEALVRAIAADAAPRLAAAEALELVRVMRAAVARRDEDGDAALLDYGLWP